VLANQPGAIQQVIQTLLNNVAVRGVQMAGIGGELPGLGQHMDGDNFAALVEHSHQPGLPPRPHLPTHILWRHRIIRPLQLDVAVPMHHAGRFFKHRK
jgi:hypothetical protein